MSRRWTGWVLTAAAITAGPAPALSSNDLNEDLQPIVAHVGTMPLPRDSGRTLAGDDTNHTDCLEVVTPHEYVVLRGGKVLVLQWPYLTSNATATLRFDSGVTGDADEQLLGAIDRNRNTGSAQAMLPWPSIPTGGLLPEGMVQTIEINAACGIPRGLTLLVSR